jgi:parvulin-like peptidyl-prolyl isomerase
MKQYIRAKLRAPELRWVSVLIVIAVSVCVVPACVIRPAQQDDAEELRTLEDAPWGDPDVVIATVNDSTITRGEYYRRVLERFGTLSILGGVLKDELFRQEAERRVITVSDQEIAAFVNDRLMDDASKLAMDMPGDVSPERAVAELERLYSQEGLSLDDVRHDYSRQAEQQLLNDKVVKALRTIDDDSLRKHYHDTWAQTRYGVSHIAYSYAPGGAPDEIRRQECLEKALRAKREVTGGRPFAEVAQVESEDDMTRRQGGKIGYVTLEMPMHPVMRDAIERLGEGETSDPLDNPEIGSVHLFRVDEVLPHRAFDEVREAMVQEIQDTPPEPQEIMEALRKLQERSNIEVRIKNPGAFEH